MEEIRRRMNIFSAISAVIVVLLIILLCQYIKAHPAQDVNNIYARSATVCEVNGNVQFYTDDAGNEWSTTDENVSVGNKVLLVMDTMGTSPICDDEIIEVRAR